MTTRHLRFTFALLGAAGCADTSPMRIVTPSPTSVLRDVPAITLADARTSGVVFHRGLVWLRGASGSLLAVDPQRGSIMAALAGEKVVDVHRTLDDRLWVLSVAGDDVRVWERIEGGFARLLSTAAPGSPLLALSDWAGRPVLLATRSTFVGAEGGAVHTMLLDAELEAGRVPHVAFAVTADGNAYAGMNSGEWGGALYRIELSSGHVMPLRRVDGPGLCDGPFNPACDPITAVIPDPDAPACVLASIGLLHMLTETGGLLRVCGAKVSVVHLAGIDALRPLPDAGKVELALGAFFREGHTRTPPSVETWQLSSAASCGDDGHECPSIDFRNHADPPIFGMSRTKRGFWMATSTDLYFVRAGRATLFDMPPLAPRGNLRLGWAPGLIVTSTDANLSSSVSGYTPLVSPTSLDGPDSDDVARFPWLRWLGRADLDGPCWLVDPDPDNLPEHERVLCFEGDHFFAKDQYRLLRGPVRWTQAAGDTWIAHISDHESVRMRFGRAAAAATYVSPYHRDHVHLVRVGEYRWGVLKDIIAKRPPASR